jgi:RNA polymerase sigma factor (sigma-70 family)
MQEKTDIDLLRTYAATGSDQAFECLVQRHINLVYSTALRITRDRDLADEVTQAVFVVLSRKARSLPTKIILTGWLYRTARFASGDALKSKRRRNIREQEAAIMQTMPDSDSNWDEVAPLLDAAMGQLPEKDRNLILLRFFENKSLKEVGVALGISDDTAQKRIARGLEKLRGFFGNRGVVLSTSSLASLLSAQAIQTAPAGCVALTTPIVTGGSSLSISTATIVKGTLNMFIAIQLKNAALVALALLIAAGGATLVVQKANSQTAVAATPSTPVQALKQLAQAVTTHDSKAFLSVVHAETPSGVALVSTTLALVDAQAHFKQAVAEKFTQERASAVMATVNFTAFQFGQNNFDTAEVSINGDQATVSIPSRSNPARSRSHKMVNRNGGWRLDVDAKSEHATDKNLNTFAAVAASIESTAREVRAGKYQTVEQAIERLKSQAIAAATSQE